MREKRPPSQKLPRPPEADVPIAVPLDLYSIDREIEGLGDLISAVDARNLEAAIAAADRLFKTSESAGIHAGAVGLVNNLAVELHQFPRSLGALLQTAVDSGLRMWAYNAGNVAMDNARTIADYKLAEKYFKIAMTVSEHPDLQAAAYVNYCPIVRDGLISGKKNWPAAVELYESAANLGLIKGTVNAGNVSYWLANEGVPGYAARAAKWFQRALDFADSGKPHLDMEPVLQLRAEVLVDAQLDLAGLHIDERFEGSDPEYGIRLAKQFSGVNERAHHYYSIGLRGRLSRLADEPSDTPAGNWRSVLRALDWNIADEIAEERLKIPGIDRKRADLLSIGDDTVGIEVVDVLVDEHTAVPLLVIDDPCFFDAGGQEIRDAVSAFGESRFPRGFFMVSRKAYFVPSGQRVCTPISVRVPGGKKPLQSLAPGITPADLVRRAADGSPFDSPLGTWDDCMLSICVNALDEGFSIVRDRVDQYQRCLILGSGPGGEWRMPFIDEFLLLEWGRALGESADGAPPPPRSLPNRRRAHK